jgi:hypothetical protein
MTRARRLICVLAGIVAATALSVAAVAQGDGEPSPSAPPNTPVASDVDALVGALRQARSADDALPAEAARQAADAAPGISRDRSVRARNHGHRWTMYLLPATNAACISLVDASGGSSTSCQTAEGIRTGSGVPSAVMTECEGPPPEVAPPTCENLFLYGIVPDGVREISIDVRNGNDVRADVVNNVYAVDVPVSDRPAALSYSSQQGPVTQVLPY